MAAIFRPSALPKLAECLHFEGLAEAGPAAERGTRIDKLFRGLISDMPGEGTTEEYELATRAANMVMQDADGEPLIVDEKQCALRVLDDDFNELLKGTADALCPSRKTLYDLKTGQQRNYAQQMAAYALACMERYGDTKWTTKLVYVDHSTIVPRDWTYEEARHVVLDLWTRWQNRHHLPPTPCDYCTWCAKGPGGNATCPAVQQAITPINDIQPLPQPLTIELLATDANAAGRFLRGMSILEKIKDEVVKRAKEGGLLPAGYKLSERTRKEVNLDALAEVIRKHGWRLFIETGAKPSVEALQKWAQEKQVELPAGAIAPGKPYLVLAPSSKTTAP